MPTTLETRWFKQGSLPADLRDWLEEYDPGEPSRWTDLYLPSDDAGLNLKVRDDKLQIKRRLAGPTLSSFGPRATGRYEQWTKWSFDLADETPDLGPEEMEALWIPVEKTRRQRRFDPDMQTTLDEELPTSSSTSVLLELTELLASDKHAWTLCLEAEGPPPGLVQTLKTAGAKLLDASLPISLSADDSYGYVEWLHRQPSVQARPAPEILIPDAR